MRWAMAVLLFAACVPEPGVADGPDARESAALCMESCHRIGMKVRRVVVNIYRNEVYDCECSE